MEAKQLGLFPWAEKVMAQPEEPKPKPKPKKPKVNPDEVKAKPKKVALKLIEGEVAYQCPDCDEKPTIYDRIKPKIKCGQCGFYLEVIDEKIPEINTEGK